MSLALYRGALLKSIVYFYDVYEYYNLFMVCGVFLS